MQGAVDGAKAVPRKEALGQLTVLTLFLLMQNLLWDLSLSLKYIISSLFFKKLFLGPSFRHSKYIKQCIKEIKLLFIWRRIPAFQSWHVCSRRQAEIKLNMTSRWNEFRIPCSLFTFKLSWVFVFVEEKNEFFCRFFCRLQYWFSQHLLRFYFVYSTVLSICLAENCFSVFKNYQCID